MPRKGSRKGGGSCPGTPLGTLLSSQEGGFLGGFTPKNGAPKNTQKLGITNPGPKVPQSRRIEGAVSVSKVFGCRRNV